MGAPVTGRPRSRADTRAVNRYCDMKHSIVSGILFAACMFGSAGAAFPQDNARPRIPTVTRLVQQFGGLEASLVEAVQNGDSATLERMLADDFEMRVGARPGTPTPRADWIRRSLAGPNHSYGIEQMAVHGFGDVAVVSFLGRRGQRDSLFITDVWVAAGGAWKLAVRYAGPAGGDGFSVPGAP